MTYQEAGESNLAKRVARERQARGWSAGDVQQRLAEVDCTIPRNAVLRIEQGQRSVHVDELLGFSRAFGLTVADLLTPVELLGQQDAERIASAVQESMRAIIASCRSLEDALQQLRKLHEAEPEAGEYLLNLLAAPVHKSWASGDPEPDDEAEDLAQDAISEIWRSVYRDSEARFGHFLIAHGIGSVPNPARPMWRPRGGDNQWPALSSE